MHSRTEHLADLFPAKTHTPEETQELGARLGELLTVGDILALYGTLGSGKTQFVKGIARAWGIPPERVSSPTFTLIHEYAGTRGPVYHMDLYRIRHPEELFELGYEEYFYGPGLTVVEWPERIEELLPPSVLRLELRHAGPSAREIALRAS